MRRAPTWRTAVLLALAVPAGAAGQSAPASRPTVAEVRRLLRSDDPADVAWGAWHCSEGKLKNVQPDLEAALTRNVEHRQEAAWQRARLALLDAMVQIGARVAPRALATWAEPPAAAFDLAPILILASRDPRGHALLLLDLAESATQRAVADHDAAWAAACNLLLIGDPAGLLRHLAPAIRIRVNVRVDGDPIRVTGRGAYGGGEARLAPPDRFPPAAMYRLMADPPRGVELLAPGPSAVGWTRGLVHTPPASIRVAPIGVVDRADHALACAVHLAGLAGERSLHATMPIDHTWRDAAAYRDEVGARVAAIHATWNEVIDRLLERQFVDRDTAADLRTRVTVTIDDQRAGTKLAPLPDLEPPASRRQ